MSFHLFLTFATACDYVLHVRLSRVVSTLACKKCSKFETLIDGGE